MTPSNTLSSVSLAVTVASLLIWAAVAVTAVPSNVIEEADTPPDTTRGLVAVISVAVKVITEAPSLCPTFEPSTTILSTAKAPAVTVLVLSSVILPNPDTIEPDSSEPTVFTVEPPARGAYNKSASAELILPSIWVWISDDTPLKYPNSCDDTSVKPAILLISLAEAVTWTPLINNVVVSTAPSTTAPVAESVIRSVFVEWPIVDADNLRLPISAELLVNLVDVVMSFVILIGPKSPDSEPLVKAPTVVIDELPALTENLLSASVSV